jgi:chemotaxis protein CheZ
MDNETSYLSLEQARELVSALEQGKVADANKLLEIASQSIQHELFDGVGKLTRQFHDSFTKMSMDERFTSMVNLSIPDAKERLEYVVEMTSDAANKTMDAVDECLPLAQKHHDTVRDILPSWERLKNCKIKVGEFKLLRDKLDNYFDESVKDAQELNVKLNDIVLAQGYQDLTGQVLQKISEMVKSVEEDLISLLKLFGQYEQKEPALKVDNCIKADGPIVPASKKHDVVSGQDDVDDLLSSLGF